jgi:hypothetical protein
MICTTDRRGEVLGDGDRLYETACKYGCDFDSVLSGMNGHDCMGGMCIDCWADMVYVLLAAERLAHLGLRFRCQVVFTLLPLRCCKDANTHAGQPGMHSGVWEVGYVYSSFTS